MENNLSLVSVAQLDRAQASDAWCRWFESNRVHQNNRLFRRLFFVYSIDEKERFPVGSCEEREKTISFPSAMPRATTLCPLGNIQGYTKTTVFLGGCFCVFD